MEDYDSLRESTSSPGNKLSSAQLRKIKKPLIEKRRRERINDSLNQLKVLVLDALEKDEHEYNKMEKADILEMTVQHLLHLKKRTTPVESPLTPVHRYQTGFHECAQEVQRFLGNASVNPVVKDRLCSHLSSCMDRYPVGSSCCSHNTDSVCSRPILPKPTHMHASGANFVSCASPTSTETMVINSPATSASAVVPVVIRAANGVDVLSGSTTLPGIIPLYSQTVPYSFQAQHTASGNQQKTHSYHHTDQSHDYKLQAAVVPSSNVISSYPREHSPSYASLFTDHKTELSRGRNFHDNRLEIEVDHLKHFSQSLPGSPVSSRGFDTPSPGSTVSERSCVSDVWRPW